MGSDPSRGKPEIEGFVVSIVVMVMGERSLSSSAREDRDETVTSWLRQRDKRELVATSHN